MTEKPKRKMGPFPQGTPKPHPDDLAEHLLEWLDFRNDASFWADEKVHETLRVSTTGWQPIETAPRDGTEFLWLWVITVLGEEIEFEPQAEPLKRDWFGEEKIGNGYWMGKYTSKGDASVFGWWKPFKQNV